MSAEKELIIKLDLRSIVNVSATLLLVLLGLYALYVDFSTSYTWVYPLDHLREIFLFYKTSVLIQTHSVLREQSHTIYVEGINAYIRVNSSNDYAIVFARGLSLYTLTIVLSSIVVYTIFRRRLRCLFDGRLRRSITSSILLAVLFAIPLLSQIIVVSHGVSLGYETDEDYAVIELKDKAYRIVDINGTRYVVYLFHDDISGDYVTLVSYKLNIGDTVLPLLILEYHDSGKAYRSYTYTGSMYIKRGNVNITILSITPLTNTSLIYYKATFKHMGNPSSILIVLPLLMLVASSISSYVLSKLCKLEEKVL